MKEQRNRHLFETSQLLTCAVLIPRRSFLPGTVGRCRSRVAAIAGSTASSTRSLTIHQGLAPSPAGGDEWRAMTATFSFRADPSVPDFDDHAPVAVMDAECAVCTWGARMIHRLDRSGTVRICPGQSPLGSALLRHYGLHPDDPSTWLFIDEGIAYRDADAIIRAGRRVGGWGRAAAVLGILPRPLRDWLYQRLARNRYRLFGRADMCAMPDPDFQRRLLR